MIRQILELLFRPVPPIGPPAPARITYFTAERMPSDPHDEETRDDRSE